MERKIDWMIDFLNSLIFLGYFALIKHIFGLSQSSESLIFIILLYLWIIYVVISEDG